MTSSRRPCLTLAMGMIVAGCLLVAFVSSAAAGSQNQSRAAGDVCQSRYPSGTQKTIGKTTTYDRQASLYQVCEGFGAPDTAGFRLTPTMQCAIIAAAATYGGPVVDAGVSKGCTAGDVYTSLKDGNWLGAARSVGCGYFSDIFAGSVGVFVAGATSATGPGAVAIGVTTYRALAAGLKLVCGGVFTGLPTQLGQQLETKHETAVAVDVIRQGKCISERTRPVLGIQWSALPCPASVKGSPSGQASVPPSAQLPVTGGVDLASNPIVLVVDISGSMGDDDGAGRIKIDGAKLALLNFLQQVEPGTPIGLRTYPDQSGSSCNSGTVRFPIAPRDPATMSAVIRSLEPDGDTPTAEAMRAAANDLKASGYTHGTLVIVSDGESTCASPCDAARAIARSGIDLQTITVGFRISSAGQKELQCIANAMNGTYVDASDSAGLKKALAEVSRPTLTVQLKYPTSVVAEVGDDPRGLVDVTGEITNTANQLARNVVATMHFDGLSPGLTRPVLYLGNLDPGASRTVSWSFRPGLLLAGSSVSFSVSARADNTLSDGTANGSLAVEDVDSAAQAGPILHDRHHLAILGDSYSSGEGADRYIAGSDTPSDGCHRSELTYLVGAFRLPDSSVVACSGAVINDVFFPDAANHVSSQLDQLEQLQATRGVDAVVMTLAGNNALFSHLAISCLLLNCTTTIVTNFSTPWDHVSDQYFLANELNSDLRDSLTDVYTDVSSVLNSKSAVRSRGSVAPILVLGYVSPIPLTGRSCLGYLDQLTRGETAFIGHFVTSLNGMVEAAVDSARQRNVPVFYVPNTEDAFQPDHTICDAHPYARGLTSFNGAGTDVTSLVTPWTRIPALKQLLNRGKQELLHPNVQGYAAETNAIIRWSLSSEARGDATWLKSGEAAHVPALPIRTSNDDLGQLAPGSSPVLQGGTSYALTVGGFAPDSNVDIVVRSQPLLLGETHADARGTVRTRVGLPPGLSGGRHTLDVRGEAAPDGARSRTVAIPFRIAKAHSPLALLAAELGSAGAAAVAAFSWLAFGIARRRGRSAQVGSASKTLASR